MDKLIRHHFWILAFLVFPMAIYGYYSANGAMKAETTARESALDGVKNGVPSGLDANEDYSKKLAVLNDEYDKQVNEQVVALWENQLPRMVWPAIVAEDVAKDTEGKFLGPISIDTCYVYKTEYERALTKLVDSVDPVVAEALQKTIPSDKKQKVWLACPIPQVPMGAAEVPPPSDDVWAAQIDIWLTRLLFDAISKVNEGKDSITESVIRRIDAVELVGGSGTPELATAGSADSSGMDSGTELGSMMTAGTAQGVVSSLPFNPAEEFGSDLDPSAAPAGDSSGSDLGSMPGMGPAANAPRIRYIALDEAAPFRERGFYLTLIMMQSKIPDLVVELANSDWPIRVTRFHVGKNPYAKKQVGGGSLYGPMENEFSSREFAPDPGFGPGGFGSDGFGTGGFGSSGFGSGGFGAGETTGSAALGMSNAFMQKYTSGLPAYAQDSLNHPDLVAVHLCGVITIYHEPPAELLASLEPEVMVDPELPVEPEDAVMEDAATGEAVPTGEPVEGATPVPETTSPDASATETPVDSSAVTPDADTATAEPPTTEASAETPAPTAE
ncbi:MAG: hypothetical protein KDA58_05225 [Planctomycetaceae bacterium]|nr:hypothetical protein [Planctomycetaceae bacterium]